MGIFDWLTGKDERAENAFNNIKPWLTQHFISEASLHYQIYETPGLSQHPDATVLIGSGISSTLGNVGFIVEISPFGKVLDSTFLEPHGVASWHRRCAEIAKATNRTLLDVMQEASEGHRKRFDFVTNKRVITNTFGLMSGNSDFESAEADFKTDFGDDLEYLFPIRNAVQTTFNGWKEKIGPLSREGYVALLYHVTCAITIDMAITLNAKSVISETEMVASVSIAFKYLEQAAKWISKSPKHEQLIDPFIPFVEIHNNLIHKFNHALQEP